jgi:hypothetical protein
MLATGDEADVNTQAQALAAGGILRADEVVTIAARAGLELAAAAALLQMESGGGANVWGHDGVPTGGAYVKGGTVTRADYLAYLKIRGKYGAQGVGPCQLTWPPLQDLADKRGGCWDWATNCAVGFEHLASLVGPRGLGEAFRAYNGTGPAARAYSARAVGLLDRWRARLRDAAPARPVLRVGDRGDGVRVLQRALVLTADGVFGPATDSAVRGFQRGHGLVADGVVGGATWRLIDRLAA